MSHYQQNFSLTVSGSPNQGQIVWSYQIPQLLANQKLTLSFLQSYFTVFGAQSTQPQQYFIGVQDLRGLIDEKGRVTNKAAVYQAVNVQTYFINQLVQRDITYRCSSSSFDFTGLRNLRLCVYKDNSSIPAKSNQIGDVLIRMQIKHWR